MTSFYQIKDGDLSINCQGNFQQLMHFSHKCSQYCRLTGIKHWISSPYHPQTTGLDERTNQTLKRAHQVFRGQGKLG